MKLQYFDLHCDTATKMYADGSSFLEPTGHINAPALSVFEHMTQFFAVFINDANRNLGMDYFRAVTENLKEETDQIRNLTPMLSTEGGNVIEGDPANLDLLAEYGVKIFGFVWNGKNALATGALCDNSEGLTETGKDAAKRLEKLGIYPDCSHLSDRGFFDLADTFAGPIIATHSNARSVFDHPRNLTDEQLRLIFERGGLVGLNLYPNIIGESPSIEDLLPHAQKMLDLGGENGLCLGCDLDGVSALPSGFNDVSDIPVLYAVLENEFGKTLAEKIVSGNASRFFGQKQ